MTNRVLPARLRPGTGASLIAGLIAVLLMFMASGAISYLNTRMLRRDAALITHSYEVLSTLDEILSLAKDAETGQRGYLITGDEKYLDPYAMALARIDEELADLERLTRNDPAQLARIPALKAAIERKLLELNETLSLRRKQGFEAVRESVNSDRGKSRDGRHPRPVRGDARVGDRVARPAVGRDGKRLRRGGPKRHPDGMLRNTGFVKRRLFAAASGAKSLAARVDAGRANRPQPGDSRQSTLRTTRRKRAALPG